ncbi:unnamed protein product [Ceutorhynchus assimilis]|uniref:Uncharacterized protein n=1 Tax=Ceutorhynchus assimilis TaxID=467358 RepID=A0A9P0DMN8_9CUCU|nr:unnamed protein product [Ceutorhynchus assimilis]
MPKHQKMDMPPRGVKPSPTSVISLRDDAEKAKTKKTTRLNAVKRAAQQYRRQFRKGPDKKLSTGLPRMSDSRSSIHVISPPSASTPPVIPTAVISKPSAKPVPAVVTASAAKKHKLASSQETVHERKRARGKGDATAPVRHSSAPLPLRKLSKSVSGHVPLPNPTPSPTPNSPNRSFTPDLKKPTTIPRTATLTPSASPTLSATAVKKIGEKNGIPITTVPPDDSDSDSSSSSSSSSSCSTCSSSSSSSSTSSSYSSSSSSSSSTTDSVGQLPAPAPATVCYDTDAAIADALLLYPNPENRPAALVAALAALRPKHIPPGRRFRRGFTSSTGKFVYANLPVPK